MEVPEAFWLIKRGKRQFKNECKSGRKKKSGDMVTTYNENIVHISHTFDKFRPNIF